MPNDQQCNYFHDENKFTNNVSCTGDTGDTGRTIDFNIQLPNNISCTGDTGRTTDFNIQLPNNISCTGDTGRPTDFNIHCRGYNE